MDFANPLWVTPDADTASSLHSECLKELDAAHPLHGRIEAIVGRCNGCDDVLARLKNDEGFALVHLTWSGKKETPPWPNTDFLGGFIATESVIDQHEH